MLTSEQLIATLTTNFSSALIAQSDFRNELTCIIKKEFLLPVCTFLRDDAELQFDSLRDITAVDYLGFEETSGASYNHDTNIPHRSSYEYDERFQIVYNLYSFKNNFRLRLKILLNDGEHVLTVSTVWQAANWYERETYDMFGIQFDEHPDLRRMYLPEEFEYHPLRKEFPLMGIPGSLPLPRH
ncbi:MAG: NADH-quinone oxidoreductase subunit C [Bacteroidota bacterium]